MAINPHIPLLSLLLIVPSFLQGTLATQFYIINNATHTPGGRRFDTEIGVPYAIETVSQINRFIWQLFKQDTPAKRKNVNNLRVWITDVVKDGLSGFQSGDNIYISVKVINMFEPGKAKFSFAQLMHHETTHVFQWSGQFGAPGGLTEGIAQYVVLRSKYFEPQRFPKPGAGNKWDEGYDVTARFLEYCDSLRPGFTADLNNMMRYVYKESYFKDLLGKPVDQVWREYKAKYAQN